MADLEYRYSKEEVEYRYRHCFRNKWLSKVWQVGQTANIRM